MCSEKRKWGCLHIPDLGNQSCEKQRTQNNHSFIQEESIGFYIAVSRLKSEETAKASQESLVKGKKKLMGRCERGYHIF